MCMRQQARALLISHVCSMTALWHEVSAVARPPGLGKGCRKAHFVLHYERNDDYRRMLTMHAALCYVMRASCKPFTMHAGLLYYSRATVVS
ncbi:hypothetical protein COO60DRAFT_1482549 [Scenedesmus sp. NREL 46B-D3]|nr:hypothetical protein COO60DRAFT_1482549 [Scenedesmus sp. NREL 46B-D3]